MGSASPTRNTDSDGRVRICRAVEHQAFDGLDAAAPADWPIVGAVREAGRIVPTFCDVDAWVATVQYQSARLLQFRAVVPVGGCHTTRWSNKVAATRLLRSSHTPDMKCGAGLGCKSGCLEHGAGWRKPYEQATGKPQRARPACSAGSSCVKRPLRLARQCSGRRWNSDAAAKMPCVCPARRDISATSVSQSSCRGGTSHAVWPTRRGKRQQVTNSRGSSCLRQNGRGAGPGGLVVLTHAGRRPGELGRRGTQPFRSVQHGPPLAHGTSARTASGRCCDRCNNCLAPPLLLGPVPRCPYVLCSARRTVVTIAITHGAVTRRLVLLGGSLSF
ncbi:hypothetical protein VFPBJ_04250 [Purpureocillium lilacinum]|uniref:Uncharacterized protein n=1 Tax=Purpureocillium lilacinum TaxID=33203 RepID=A0A179GUN9_PURLI|nr:hypothetical protein VFPBJ_04250 [Purpureocillium lilacinum]